MVDDNLTLECFLSLLDRAEASIVNDNLFESSDEYDYSVKDNEKIVEVMEDDISYSANELLTLLNIKSKETLRASYLNPALENGLIKMTLPDKPNSKNQKYIK